MKEVVDGGLRRHDVLAEMSFAELQEELAAARVQVDAADFQERLSDWKTAKAAAQARLKAAEDEADRRLAALKVER